MPVPSIAHAPGRIRTCTLGFEAPTQGSGTHDRVAHSGEPRKRHGSELGARSAEDLARALLARAATAPTPQPLIDAAQALLEQARAERGVVSIEDARRKSGG